MKTRFYSITVGQPSTFVIAQAQGEDCQHVFTFAEPAAPLGTGLLVDFTTLAASKAIATIRDPFGNLVASRVGAVVGAPTAGTLGFVVYLTDLLNQAVQVCTVDVKWTDTVGNTEQLLVAEPFDVLQSVSQPTDVPTLPPPLPILPLFKRAHFDGTTAQVAITWPLQPADVWAICSQPQTDEVSAIVCSVVNVTVTRSGCTVQASAPFIGEVFVQVVPKANVL